MEKKYVLSPQTLAFSNDVFAGRKLHSFQSAIKNVFKQEEQALIVSAPTAAGKTYAFGLPTIASPHTAFGKRKSMVIVPTNNLSDQIANDLKEEWGKNISVIRFSASDIRARGVKKPAEIFEKIRENDIIVTNPDIISLLVSGFYYRWLNEKEKDHYREWTDIFRRISFMIFDEYHIYPEEELAKILSFIVLGNVTGNSHIKYIFTSATPNNSVKELLQHLDISIKEIVEKGQTGISEGRTYRGTIEVIFTDEKIQDAVTPDCPKDKRTLFLFDRVVGYERAAKKLIDAGLTDFEEISGFANRLEDNTNSHIGSPIVLATNAAEHGLNLDVDVAHIEPGRNLENFWQRFGRVARRGKDGQIIVHIDSERLKLLPAEVNDYEGCVAALETIMEEREVYINRILSNMDAYMFLVYKKTGKRELRNQIWNAASRLPGFKAYFKFDECLKKLRNNLSFNSSEQDIDSFEEWWDTFLISHSWFRGQTETVRISHREGEVSSGDYKWLLRNTEYTTSRDERGEYYVIQQFLDEPKDLTIYYSGPMGDVRFSGPEIFDHRLLRSKWECELRKFIKESFLYFRETRQAANELMYLLPTILASMYPTLLKPSGVDAFVDDQFL
jgi:CRISPR-associated endonuclease/helicase Cas3